LPWLSRFLMNKLYGQSGWWKLLLNPTIPQLPQLPNYLLY
jgi:hypothetical protein